MFQLAVRNTRLNPLPVRNNPPIVHTATIVVVEAILLWIGPHQSKRVTRPTLLIRMMIPLLRLPVGPMPATNTLTLFSLFTFLSTHFQFRGCVRFWRITTHRLYTTLHNLITIDFLCCLIATLYLFQYTLLACFLLLSPLSNMNNQLPISTCLDQRI